MRVYCSILGSVLHIGGGAAKPTGQRGAAKQGRGGEAGRSRKGAAESECFLNLMFPSSFLSVMRTTTISRPYVGLELADGGSAGAARRWRLEERSAQGNSRQSGGGPSHGYGGRTAKRGARRRIGRGERSGRRDHGGRARWRLQQVRHYEAEPAAVLRSKARWLEAEPTGRRGGRVQFVSTFDSRSWLD